MAKRLRIGRTFLTLILKDKSKEIGNDTINTLSKISQSVYKEIQKDSSISKPQIAKNLGISTPSVSRAIDELKKSQSLIR